MPVRSSLQEPFEDVWVTFHRTYDSISKCKDNIFTEFSLPYQQFMVLNAIIEHISDPVSPTSIAEWFDRNPNSITLIIDRMEKDGLVKRVIDKKDRRRLKIIVTPRGKEKHEQALKAAHELAKEIFASLSPEELTSFYMTLMKVREATFKYRNIQDKTIDNSPVNNNRD